MQSLDPLLIALFITAGLLAVVLGVAWRRSRRHAERVTRLESRADARLEEVKSEHTRRVERLTREWDGVRERAHLRLALDLLPALDAVDAALESATPGADLTDGLEMIRREILTAFEAHDIERIAPSPGEAFAPEIHEAVDVVEPTDEAPDGTISTCRRAGYRHPANVLRPAMVTVARS